MKALAGALQSIAVTLWVGSLWTVGYLVAPLLFAGIPDRAMAGALAGNMFAYAAYVGVACALYLLTFQLARCGVAALRQAFFWITALMLLLIFAGEFGVRPILEGLKAQAAPKDVMESVFRSRFTTWHDVASGLYVIESMLGIALVLVRRRGVK